MLILKIFSAIYIIVFVLAVKEEFTVRPSKKLLKSLNGVDLTRYAKSHIIMGSNMIHLKPTDSWKGNITSYFKPVTWFFIGEPTKKNLTKNNISSTDIKIKIPLYNLDPDKIIYRKHDNVIGYLAEYKGYARIEKSDLPPVRKFGVFKQLSFWIALIQILLFLVAIFILFGIIGAVVSYVFMILIIILSVVDSIRTRIRKRLNKN